VLDLFILTLKHRSITTIIIVDRHRVYRQTVSHSILKLKPCPKNKSRRSYESAAEHITGHVLGFRTLYYPEKNKSRQCATSQPSADNRIDFGSKIDLLRF
jgi:hypothetical protein